MENGFKVKKRNDDEEGKQTRMNLYKNKLNSIILEMPEKFEFNEKVKYLYMYLVNELSYDYEALNIHTKDGLVYHTAFSSIDTEEIPQEYRNIGNTGDSVTAFLHGKSICSATSQIFKDLCDLAGIKCEICEGKTVVLDKDTGLRRGHAWNIVEDEKENRSHVDITYGQFIKDEHDFPNKEKTRDILDFCMVSDELLKRRGPHMITSETKPCNYTAPTTHQFQYSNVDSELVATNIDEYIIPECQEACKELWSKNIFTFMCSNREDGENKYILVNAISSENEEIFKKLIELDPEHYGFSSHRNTYGIYAQGTDEEVAKQLVELTKHFKMQDVLEGYKTVNNFLIQRFDISKTVPNPDFVKGIKEPKMEDFSDIMDFFKAQDEYYEIFNKDETIKVFDESKMEKTVEEYLLEAGVLDLYDAERGVVYDSEFYKNAHFKYLEYVNGKDTVSLLQQREDELSTLESEAKTISEVEAIIDMQTEEKSEEVGKE